jgi:hypothetical protein
MRSLAAVALACLVAMTGAHAQNTAKSAAAPGAQGARPLPGAAPGPASRPQGTQRSLPHGKAAQTPQDQGGDLTSEQARRMQQQMDATSRSSTAASNVSKKNSDTSKAITSNMK